jgi:NAD+ synthetase
MTVALLQLNPTIGDFKGNAMKLLEALHGASRAGAKIAIASELVLPGYPPRDLLDRPRFVEQCARWTRYVVERTADVALVFGTLGGHPGQLSNDAVAAADSAELCRSSKVLLPTYDVFDEHRHFRPGTAIGRFTYNGRRFAISICEDAWATVPEVAGRYSTDPIEEVSAANTDLLINLSASPFTLSKLERRDQLFEELARRHDVPVAMVNQVGGNDELLFDGRSALISRSGELLARARAFESDVVVATLDAPGRIEPSPTSPEAAAYAALVMGVRDYAGKCGFDTAVLGLSGGIDSALVAALAVDALGATRVIGVAMPTRYSSAHSVADAKQLASNLGMRFELIDIDRIFQQVIDEQQSVLDRLAAPSENDVTWENVQARIRGATVMAISNRTGALPLTTGNKSELAVGYCTLYGDMVGGLSVINDVPKTMVYKIARWINRDGERIPTSTLTKPPSAELRPDQLDQDSLPPYDVLDAVLQGYVEDHKSAEELVAQGFDAVVVERIVRLIKGAEYKRRQSAPGLIITRKAFGLGRRVPVAQRYLDLPGNNS